MFKQTEEKYKSVMLGFGTSSIYSVGCYLVSLCNGLNKKGYSFTPESLNDMLKTRNAFIGDYKNYIDVINLDNYFPSVFGEFQQIDPWNDVPTTQELLNGDKVVVCKVNAKAIGGTGTHFVLLTGIVGGVAMIHDPWTGVEEKITVRYGKLGNILGVRIFNIKPYAVVNPLPPQTPVKIDLGEPYGPQEVQAIKSMLNDKDRDITNLRNEIEQLKRVKEEYSDTIDILNNHIKEIEKIGNELLEMKIKAREIVFGRGWTWVKVKNLKQLLG